MRTEWKRVVGMFGTWILIALITWIMLPEKFQWLKWIPLAFIVLALILAGSGILLIRLGYFKLRRAWVNGKVLTSCAYCPLCRPENNPVSKRFPIYKCEKRKMKTIYNPNKVPGWCPHAAR